MIDCIQPGPADRVVDPACGTVGFLLAAHAFAAERAEDLNPDQRDLLRDVLVTATELVDRTARLAPMNLLLHGIGKPGGDSLITVGHVAHDLQVIPRLPTVCADHRDRGLAPERRLSSTTENRLPESAISATLAT